MYVLYCDKSLQSCPTLCNPMDYSPLGSSVHGILQAGILEWVALPLPRSLICVYILCVYIYIYMSIPIYFLYSAFFFFIALWHFILCITVCLHFLPTII